VERLGLDIGSVRTGVALGAHQAREYATLDTRHQLVATLVDIIKKEAVDELVVGMPIRSDGSVGEVGALVEQVTSAIKQALPHLRIATTNEAFSSTEAEIDLKEHGVTIEEMRKRVDQYAAMLILDQYNHAHPVES
jgi:putative Holliday junction resolvase